MVTTNLQAGECCQCCGRPYETSSPDDLTQSGVSEMDTTVRQTFPSHFKLGDRVEIDADASVKAVVIGVLFRFAGQECELSWMHNGGHQSAWIASWRLTLVE